MNKQFPLKNMANSFALLPSLFILMLVSTLRTTVSAITQATSTVAKDDLVPCTMCAECENPCQPLPPPPPPVIECPPPPPPPSPPLPPPPPPPPAVVECPPPPPPKPSCPGNCEMPPYPPGSYFAPYFPPGTPFPDQVSDNDKNNGAKMMPIPVLLFSNPRSYSVYFTTQSLVYLAFLCLPYYLFI